MRVRVVKRSKISDPAPNAQLVRLPARGVRIREASLVKVQLPDESGTFNGPIVPSVDAVRA